MTFLSQCLKATQRFRGQRNPEDAVGDVVHVFCVNTTIRRVVLGVWGGVCLRFPVSCFLMWSDGIVHMEEGVEKNKRMKKGKKKKKTAAKGTTHYIPIH